MYNTASDKTFLMYMICNLADHQFLLTHTSYLLNSYAHWLGRPLLHNCQPDEAVRQLFMAPFVVVSHGTQVDPVLNYGNQMALDLWEMDWSKFISTPSRITAEPVHRQERQRLLQCVNAKGYIDNYSGIRITSTGRRFRINAAIVWNLLDANGNHHGQAATFNKWEYL